MNIIKERAAAKINLYLDVLHRNEDGFHAIKTVMHSVDLSDTVIIKKLPAKEKKITLYVKNSRFLPHDDKNLAYRAAEMFLTRAKIDSSVEIVLIKHIPVSAGLAGGSSDAAAVLRGLNKLFGKPFTAKMLYKIAAELGSDVPYCVYGKTALCEGRGEIMTLLPDKLRLYAVVAIAKERMSTPIAYSELDKLYSNFDGSVNSDGEKHFKKIMESVESGVLSPDGLYNIFEKPVLPLCKRAGEIKEKLLSLGAVASLMSGSGPSVFGIFESESAAKAACQALAADNVYALACKSI